MTDKDKQTKLSKSQKKEIIDRHGSIPTEEMYTDGQWSRLMWASHSEVNKIEREIAEENVKRKK